jgi:phosphoserine phosphatase
MHSVLTIVGEPTTRLVSGQVVTAARQALAAIRAETGAVDWLAPSLACDILFDHAKPAAAEAAVREALGDQPFDLAAQPLADRRKRLLLADMDSTIVTAETLDELADHCGIKDEIATITLKTMKGELPFEESLKLRVAKLQGLSIEKMVEVVQALELAPGARSLVRTMRAHGAYAALVSGGFTFFTERIAEAAGFDENRANVLEFEGGSLAGTVREPILSRQAKLDTLEELTRRLAIDRSLTLAIGDGANDLAMITAAGLGVAFHAKPAVAVAAHARIDHGDLEALLYVQGYHAGEIVG